MASVNDIRGLAINFSDVSKFCNKTGSKHEAKGYKYFKEKYLNDVTGTVTDA